MCENLCNIAQSDHDGLWVVDWLNGLVKQPKTIKGRLLRASLSIDINSPQGTLKYALH